jgi:peroxiredoxin (alkyl hydroperoxide reductase subunit C)
MSLVGSPAPDFRLLSTKNFDTLDDDVALGDYRGRWLVLFFYPADFTFVCPTEVLAFSSKVSEYAEFEADVVAVSTDSVHCHQAWCEFAIGRLNFPLAADTSHAVTSAYGVLQADGMARRAVFIIDPEGVIRYEVVHDDNVGRNPDEILRVLQALRADARTPAGWQFGEATLKAG